MLKIFYRTGIYDYQLQEPELIKGGMIASFCGNRTVRVCRPSRMPIGFFIYDFDEFNNKSHIPVAIGQGEYQTDEYEDDTYKINDLLYCGRTGKISNSKIYRGNPIIGIVNSVENRMIGFVSIFANLETSKFGDRDDRIQTRKTSVVPSP